MTWAMLTYDMGHGMCQTVHFDCVKTDLTGEQMQKFLHQLNMILPSDVRVSHLEHAPELQVFQIFALIHRSSLAIAGSWCTCTCVLCEANGGREQSCLASTPGRLSSLFPPLPSPAWA